MRRRGARTAAGSSDSDASTLDASTSDADRIDPLPIDSHPGDPRTVDPGPVDPGPVAAGPVDDAATDGPAGDMPAAYLSRSAARSSAGRAEPGAPRGAGAERVVGTEPGADRTAASAPPPRLHRAAAGLPAWLGSIKVRLAVMYSVVVFGVAAVLMAGVYFGLSRALAHQPVTEQQLVIVPSPGAQTCYRFGSGFIRCVQGEVTSVEVDNDFRELEKAVNQRALVQFRRYSFAALGGLFGLSLVVGWVLADRALRPIGRISKVAREIQATDLSRRIDLAGPDDEMKDLADTFDGMLERLEAAFESQRQFIHEASHELRNPIAVVRTNVDVALADPDAPAEELRETLQVVGRASARMGVLVDDLLTYARRESPASRESVVDLADVIRETTAEFEAAAETRELGLRAATPEGLLVSGDAVALKQALANLLANAVGLAPGGSAVTVAGGRDGPYVWMAVGDEGPGIAPADQARVFERFWKGDGRQGKGEAHSGLGLTIVRQIARGHGGSVNLESVPGRGSTFSIWLPSLSTPSSVPKPEGLTVGLGGTPRA